MEVKLWERNNYIVFVELPVDNLAYVALDPFDPEYIVAEE